MDEIHIDGLNVQCIVGCNGPERVREQRIVVHLTLFVDSSLCGRTDALEHTVNYAALAKSVSAVCTQARSFTLEALCPLVAREALLGPVAAGLVERVRVRIEKPEALKAASWPAVQLERTRAFFEAEDARWGPPRSVAARAAPLPHATLPDAIDNTVAFLTLGSNVGARSVHLRTALRLLTASADQEGQRLPPGKWLRVEDTSRLFETPPAYVTDQRPFLNAAARVRTNLTPHELLSHIKANVEGHMGRPLNGEGQRFGPRVIDVDIALWGGGVCVDDGETLIVPHARLAERAFALVPLADVAGGEVHPVLLATIDQLVGRLGGRRGGRGAVGVGGGVQPVIAFPRPVGAIEGSDEELVLSLGSRTFVMGILNATPDSFSDGGELNGGETVDVDAAVTRAQAMVAAGVDVLDIGGQSTRPGAMLVSAEIEAARVVPVIKAVRLAVGPRIGISIDTTSALVATAAVGAGANCVNDVSGGLRDARMHAEVARLGVPYILMHSRGSPATMMSLAAYAGAAGIAAAARAVAEEEGGAVCGEGHAPAPPAAIIDDMEAETTAVSLEVPRWLVARAELAMSSGRIPRWDIILDPGLGFAKLPPHSFALLRGEGASRLRDTRFPLLFGPSRKAFLAAATARGAGPRDREWATAAAIAACVSAGADIVRVHDVAAHVDAARVADACFRVL